MLIADPAHATGAAGTVAHEVTIPPVGLAGSLRIPRGAFALVVFVHGSGSSRFSPRNAAVAEALNARGMATLLFDLLRTEEERERARVFDIPLLAQRLVQVIGWIDGDARRRALPLGLFGPSTGAAAALVAATMLPQRVAAIVSRGGRPDLAGASLETVTAPTLLIVGGADEAVMELNRRAFGVLHGPKSLVVVPHASHLFPEPGAMDTVIDHAARWFRLHLGRTRAAP